MAAKREATGTEGSAAPPAKKLRTSFAYGDIVTVVVGKDDNPVKFTVHKELICASSSFFRAATTGQWKEFQTTATPIRLREQPEQPFGVYVEWLYDHSTDVLDAIRVVRYVRQKETVETICQDEGYYMAKAWILGDFLGDCKFKNIIMKRLLQMEISKGGQPTGISIRLIKLILKNCPPGPGLYKWLVDVTCGLYGPALIDQCKDFAPVEFWHDMLKNYMAVPRIPINRLFLPSASQLSKYEEHEADIKNEATVKEGTKKDAEEGDRKKQDGKSSEPAHT